MSGDIDADEQQALDALFEQVNELATQFYQGDIQGAFTRAMSLNYDNTELSAFALNLSHRQSWSETRSYQAIDDNLVPGQSATPTDNVPEELAAKTPVQEHAMAPLAKYLNDVLQAVEQLSERQHLPGMDRHLVHLLPIAIAQAGTAGSDLSSPLDFAAMPSQHPAPSSSEPSRALRELFEDFLAQAYRRLHD